MMKYTKYTKYTLFLLIVLIMISSVLALTKLQYRQINTDARLSNITNLTFISSVNASFIGMNASNIHAVDVLTLGGSTVVTVGGLFSNENFTVQVAAYDTLYKKGNYTSEYSSTGYDKENYSSEYSASGFDNENFSVRIDLYDTLYKTGNVTADFPNLDQSLLDDFNLADNLSTIPIAVTHNGVVIFNSDVLFFDNVSFANKAFINTSIHCSVDAACDLGNSTNRFRTGNFSSILEAGTLSDGTATLTGGVLTATKAILSSNDAQTVNAVYNNVNFTNKIDVLNITDSLWNLSNSQLIPRNLEKDVNITANLFLERNFTMEAAINQTLNGTVRYFFNGCTEFINASGYHIIC